MPYKDKEKQRLAQSKHYLKHKDRFVLRSKRRRRIAREKLFKYLQTISCEDCGNNDFRVLEFDHIDPKLKRGNVSRMAHTHTWATVEKEIKKCRVLCANCHRIRTHKQFKWYEDLLAAVSQEVEASVCRTEKGVFKSLTAGQINAGVV